jgi:flotillin
MPIAVIGALVLLVFILGMFAWLKSMLLICPPNEILVISGRNHALPDGTKRGFRVIQGGRAWRLPVIEKSATMSLDVMEIPMAIKNAYSKGGIALNVDAIANVKVSSAADRAGNAIERFLGSDPNDIRRVAKETLEGHLRGVLARLTPEEVNEDRLKFAEELVHESELDLNKLGIDLDTFKIAHVSDDVHYLDSIGREAIANVIKTAEIAESDAKRLAQLAEAQNQARANVAKANAEANIATMKNELRRAVADLNANVASEEERTKAAAREARALAEQELQGIRADVEKLRLIADEVLPAEAARTAAEIRAKADSAIVRERGVAGAASLAAITSAWQAAGDDAMAIILIEDLERLLTAASAGVQKINPDAVNVIDSGDGSALVSYFNSYPAMLQSVFASLESVTGIDVTKTIGGQS